MSPDPYKAVTRGIRPQAWNRYAYVAGDPINLYDPHGRDDCPVSESMEGPEFLGDCCGDPDDPWCEGGGGGGGGGGATPTCVFIGADIGRPDFYASTNGNGYYMPVVFNFVVINGTGTAWENQQTVTRFGFLTFANGQTSNENEAGKVESIGYGLDGLSQLWTGDIGIVFDAPGAPAKDPKSGSPTIFGLITWSCQLNVSVWAAGYRWIPCPQVDWTAFLDWTSTISNGKITQTPTGGVNVLTPPTP
jgi:hypothetical protein